MALDPSSAELIAALDAGDKLVGVPNRCGSRRRSRRGRQPDRTIDVDQTIGLKPDLVVATQTADQLDVADQRATDAAVYISRPPPS